jgi:hypothetical protein
MKSKMSRCLSCRLFVPFKPLLSLPTSLHAWSLYMGIAIPNSIIQLFNLFFFDRDLLDHCWLSWLLPYDPSSMFPTSRLLLYLLNEIVIMRIQRYILQSMVIMVFVKDNALLFLSSSTDIYINGWNQHSHFLFFVTSLCLVHGIH